jgi:hypothetical protein
MPADDISRAIARPAPGGARPRAARRAAVAETARRYPGVPVEVTVDAGERGPWRGDYLYDVPEDVLINAAVDQTPLPWSGIAPGDYPPGQSVAGTERAAGRRPHLRSAAAPEDTAARADEHDEPSGQQEGRPE